MGWVWRGHEVVLSQLGKKNTFPCEIPGFGTNEWGTRKGLRSASHIERSANFDENLCCQIKLKSIKNICQIESLVKPMTWNTMLLTTSSLQTASGKHTYLE